MPSDDKELACPACGERIYASDDRCLACGARLDHGRLVGDAPTSREDAPSADESAAPEMPPRGAQPQTAWPTDDSDARAAQPQPAQGQARADSSAEVSYDTGAAAWHPERVTGGGGLFDSLSRGWIFLRESVLMAFRDRDLIIPSVLAVVANIVLLGGLGAVLYLTGNIDAIFGEGDEKLTVVGYVTIFVVAFVSYVITYFFTGMTVHLVDVHLRGEDAQLGSAFADSVRNFGGIVVLAVASLVVNLIAGAIRGRSRRGLRDMAADTVERAWLAITYLLLPVMILEDVPFMRSTKRARTLHGHSLLQIVVGELGLMMAARVISFVVGIIGIGGAVAVYFYVPALLPVAIGVAALLFVLASAFAAYVRTAFYTCLYLWAVAMETVGEEAPAPAPLRPAIEAGW